MDTAGGADDDTLPGCDGVSDSPCENSDDDDDDANKLWLWSDTPAPVPSGARPSDAGPNNDDKLSQPDRPRGPLPLDSDAPLPADTDDALSNGELANSDELEDIHDDEENMDVAADDAVDDGNRLSCGDVYMCGPKPWPENSDMAAPPPDAGAVVDAAAAAAAASSPLPLAPSLCVRSRADVSAGKSPPSPAPDPQSSAWDAESRLVVDEPSLPYRWPWKPAVTLLPLLLDDRSDASSVGGVSDTELAGELVDAGDAVDTDSGSGLCDSTTPLLGTCSDDAVSVRVMPPLPLLAWWVSGK